MPAFFFSTPENRPASLSHRHFHNRHGVVAEAETLPLILEHIVAGPQCSVSIKAEKH
ncbi:MAG: hypothetical protein ABW118_10370 [Candidatus Thiodiazotropha sp.]